MVGVIGIELAHALGFLSWAIKAISWDILTKLNYLPFGLALFYNTPITSGIQELAFLKIHQRIR